MTERQELEQLIEELRGLLKPENPHSVGDILILKKRLSNAENLMTEKYSYIMTSTGKVAWWYCAETECHTITLNFEQYRFKDHAAAAMHFGMTVLADLIDEDEIL